MSTELFTADEKRRQQTPDYQAALRAADKIASTLETVNNIKQCIANKINNPSTTMPASVTNNIVTLNIWNHQSEIESWLHDKGFRMKIDWHDSGNGDFVDSVVIDYK